MQIIQTIRDKGAAVVIAVIALSLIGFLLMDAKSGSKGGGGFLNSLGTNVGKVNGVAIDKKDFEEKVKAATAASQKQEQQYGRKPSEGEIREQIWQGLVYQRIFTDEIEKLGIDYTPNELHDLFSSNRPDNPFIQSGNGTFIDPATGKLDATKVNQKIAEMKKAKGEEAESYEQITEQIRMNTLRDKYFALLNASAYYPTWMQERDKATSKSFATISYVAVPYNVISDSTITVTDNEISSYIDKHKKLFKQEEGRLISYVAFSQLPSAADSASAKTRIEGLKTAMTTETNIANFITKNLSNIPYDSTYQPKSKLTSPAADTLTKLPIGTVYGPYLERGDYVLAKVLGTKTLPDSTRASHILIPTNDPQSGAPIMEDSVAKNRADSILTAIKAGSDFTALAKQFGTDATKDKGGDLGFFGFSGPMVPEFNNETFGEPVGTKKVIRTRFGYHVIEITGEKGSGPAYRIAYLGQEITQSDATVGEANNNATKLSGQKSGKEMDAYIAKNGLQKVTWPTPLKENDYQLGQLQDARTLVRWVFDAKEGDVSDVYNINGQFIVAILDKIQDEGTADAKSSRRMVEGVIRNQKKAEAISKNLAANPTLDGAAAFYKVAVKTAGEDSALVYNSAFIKEIGEEPKLIGASFNKDNQTKVSAPIEGTSGVYLLKVNSIGTKADVTPEAAAAQSTQQINTLRNQATMGWYEGLKSQATIKDSRSKYY